ncbi:MAG: bifunctional (p)ppGpp synthetase/guanosine-3',5'-bis(diphosphate) 3'-pyrophosphohydrolase [Gammaproteobacteria bacterium]|nr:bifunctional (p)ppGpp synthetase/guanosine-3',5'-bis(diphosphate) 3'-pyrophosphohydrolase [Gammaproteobacteria bacterium]
MTNTIDQDAYLAAWHFACRSHLGQTLPGSPLPYINHIGGVVMEVLVALGREPVDQPDLAVQCALLHDVLEDTETGYGQIESQFGRPVAQGVLALSKDPNITDKTARMSDSLARIRRQPKEVWMVKLADRITNLQPPPTHWTPERIASYLSEAKHILQELAAGSPLLAARLEQKISAYRAYL